MNLLRDRGHRLGLDECLQSVFRDAGQIAHIFFGQEHEFRSGVRRGANSVAQGGFDTRHSALKSMPKA